MQKKHRIPRKLKKALGKSVTTLPIDVVNWYVSQGRITLSDYCKYLLDGTGEYIPPVKDKI
tara:strand:+ start:147 stop:329 length:183 start_codon:yes stop_codon:yes gene_type:complete